MKWNETEIQKHKTQVLSSSQDGRPFGHNRQRSKIGGCAPFFRRGGGVGSPCNTMWPEPRPTFVPSVILMHPTVWLQHTNVTDRQGRQTGQDRTVRQLPDGIGRTILQTVAQKLLSIDKNFLNTVRNLHKKLEPGKLLQHSRTTNI